MRDIVGNQLAIGDDVVVMAHSYRQLVIGKVISITPQKVRVSYMNTWSHNRGKEENYLVYPDNVCKIIMKE